MRRILLLIPAAITIAVLMGGGAATAQADTHYYSNDLDVCYSCAGLGLPFLPGDQTVQQKDLTVLNYIGSPWYVTEMMQYRTPGGNYQNAGYNGSDYLDRKPDTGTYTGGIQHDVEMYVPSRFDQPSNLPCNYQWRIQLRWYANGVQQGTDYTSYYDATC